MYVRAYACSAATQYIPSNQRRLLSVCCCAHVPSAHTHLHAGMQQHISTCICAACVCACLRVSLCDYLSASSVHAHYTCVCMPARHLHAYTTPTVQQQHIPDTLTRALAHQLIYSTSLHMCSCVRVLVHVRLRLPYLLCALAAHRMRVCECLCARARVCVRVCVCLLLLERLIYEVASLCHVCSCGGR